ncbi:probable leucine-rich repeat receptor-like serine/threonine-protein kinase At3g14840 [Cryptomeria japonica]|uniref:probable leucine-rich repeat receptor-like serine/threonine-protein kinase At3g14840 n=1 Tax=Cryptomeria japonica TaxID=3369 RepID=UPI0027DAAE64|nr:probable leucine-rich repeat receptor-like serine/threonine-protein kinase At3g14840 [Cryptomeria japonica]
MTSTSMSDYPPTTVVSASPPTSVVADEKRDSVDTTIRMNLHSDGPYDHPDLLVSFLQTLSAFQDLVDSGAFVDVAQDTLRRGDDLSQERLQYNRYGSHQLKRHLLVTKTSSPVHFVLPGDSTANTTDPQEVKALEIIAKKLQYKKWNFSEDPCSENGSWIKSRDKNNENLVSCNCTLDGDSFCHITQIFLKRQNLSGVIPPEFATLTYLEELDLTRNYLNGSLPVELGSLVHLKNLSLGINRLSGYIPKEFGNLSSLISLVLLSNNLSGRLPRQLAKLSALKKLHIGSNQFSGRIPISFSRFKVLNDFRASSNNFEGEIPDFIAKWKKISILRLEASSLKGPIPSKFSSLINLKDLRISDLTGGGSDLSFVSNLKNLKILVLRNALIYGDIRPVIGEFKNLKILDLGFNNLTGQIPDTFKTQRNKGYDLQYLYLGNNTLTGNLNSWLGKISHVDLSFNNYSVDFPSWVTRDTQLNLIGNSFKFNFSEERNEAYLQRNFKCNKRDRHCKLLVSIG